jgi:hypothetical protein
MYDRMSIVSLEELPKTFTGLLYELLQFVYSRRQPAAARRNNLTSDIAEDTFGLQLRLEEADSNTDLGDLSRWQALLKWKLKLAVESRAELEFEEQRVQVCLLLSTKIIFGTEPLQNKQY